MTTPEGGRRIAGPTRRRLFRPMVALGLGAMLVTVLALAVQAPAAEQGETETEAPERQPLSVADLACPPTSGSPDLSVGSASDQTDDGEVTVRPATSASSTTTIPLEPGQATRAPGPNGPVVVHGEDALAPGLLAARFSGKGVTSAAECVAPATETWFVGVGTSGLHASELELTNPDSGPAVADVALWSVDGPLDEVRSRGLTIPGNDSTKIDLSDLAPNRAELAMQVTVSRGRVAASVNDTFTVPGEAKPTVDWLTAASAPATELVVPGLSKQADSHTLVLANPGDAGGRVELKIAGRQSTFAPAGLEPIQVPAGRVVVTPLSDEVMKQLGKEDASLHLTGTVPVTASVRSVVDDDLVHLPGVPPAEGQTAAMVPPKGDHTLLVTTTTGGGSFEARFLTDGPEKTWQARLQPGTTTPVDIPDGTIGIVIQGAAPYAGGVRTVTDTGATFLPLRPLALDQILPKVTPALP